MEHLDRKIRLNTESEYKNLYSWYLEEIDEHDEKVGENLIPWIKHWVAI